MSDIMKSLPFEYLIDDCLQGYYTKGKIFEIEKKDIFFEKKEEYGMIFNEQYIRYPIGPAAGPHTQLAQNILSAYLTGSRFFELKTVQIIDGEQMRQMIEKPCIDVKNVGYNVEWSTELTVEEAIDEYIKASILVQVMAIELGISQEKDFAFNISVGYTLEGIKSEKISNFIDSLKEAKETDAFKLYIDTLKNNIDKFKVLKLEDLDKISSKITNTVTLSTMHGCKAEEVLDIVKHLVENKKINTFIKCNPTLVGYENVRSILDNLGYEDITIRKEDFDNDLKFDVAVNIIKELKKLGKENSVSVGIKLTNTLPVYNSREILPGESMYLSGKPLYPIAMGVSKLLSKAFDGDIHISLSGGIDKNNAVDVLKTGIAPVTISTLLLKPGGYRNMKSILNEIVKKPFDYKNLNVELIEEVYEKAKINENYKNKGDGKYLEDTLTLYDCFKTNCGICVDVCPNRANMKVYDDSFDAPYQIVHIENRCNECGNCHTFCTKGGFPYFKKVTLYKDMDEFDDSKNVGFVKVSENQFKVRDENEEYTYELKVEKTNKPIERLINKINEDYSYLL